MPLEVSVEKVLRKIAHHNSDVLGCIAAFDGGTVSTLPEVYDLVDIDAVVECANNMFVITDVLETGEEPFQEVFLEFQGHSFIVHKLETGMLILVANPVKRGVFRKMQLGLSLFLKPLERAIQRKINEAHAAETAQSGRLGARGLRRVFRGLV